MISMSKKKSKPAADGWVSDPKNAVVNQTEMIRKEPEAWQPADPVYPPSECETVKHCCTIPLPAGDPIDDAIVRLDNPPRIDVRLTQKGYRGVKRLLAKLIELDHTCCCGTVLCKDGYEDGQIGLALVALCEAYDDAA